MGSSSPVHVIALPLPYVGHIKPMMELCTLLADQGAMVSFVNSPHHHRRLIANPDMPEPQRFRFFELACKLPDPCGLNISLVDFVTPIYDMEQPFHSLMGHLIHTGPPASSSPNTLLLADVRIPFAQDIANMFNVPRVALWTQSAASFACTLHFSKGHKPPQDVTTLIDCIAGVPPLKREELGPFLNLDSSDPVFNFIMQPFSKLNEAKAIVLNTFEELELVTLANLRKEKNLTRPLLTMGPLLSISLMVEHNQRLVSHDHQSNIHCKEKDATCTKIIGDQSFENSHGEKWFDGYNSNFDYCQPYQISYMEKGIYETKAKLMDNQRIDTDNGVSLDATNANYNNAYDEECSTATHDDACNHSLHNQCVSNSDNAHDVCYQSCNHNQHISGNYHTMMQKCIRWLDRQAAQSVLYISFGTSLPLPLPFLEQVFTALKAACKPFLWALRPDSISHYDKPSTSWNLPFGLITPWAPQLQVLSHLSVGGFLSHCGWNSTLESLVCGVPMLTWPLFAEQRLNARCINDIWKVGVPLETNGRGFVTCLELQSKIEEIFGGKKTQINVERWRKTAIRAHESTRGSSSLSKDSLLKIIKLDKDPKQSVMEST